MALSVEAIAFRDVPRVAPKGIRKRVPLAPIAEAIPVQLGNELVAHLRRFLAVHNRLITGEVVEQAAAPEFEDGEILALKGIRVHCTHILIAPLRQERKP
jgi:hypothetical protein